MFKLELDLQNKFINLLSDLSDENTIILPEFNARFGKVDIISAEFKSKNLLNQEQAKILSIYKYAKVSGLLNKRAPHTLDYLIKHSGYSESDTLLIINKLIKSDIVGRTKTNSFILAENFNFPNLTFVSYEAKLTKWNDAILQATINQRFSNYSYVVLPDKLANRIYKSDSDIFIRYNVGLIGVSDTIQTYINPKKKKLDSKWNPSLISSFAKLQLETGIYTIV